MAFIVRVPSLERTFFTLILMMGLAEVKEAQAQATRGVGVSSQDRKSRSSLPGIAGNLAEVPKDKTRRCRIVRVDR